MTSDDQTAPNPPQAAGRPRLRLRWRLTLLALAAQVPPVAAALLAPAWVVAVVAALVGAAGAWAVNRWVGEAVRHLGERIDAATQGRGTDDEVTGDVAQLLDRVQSSTSALRSSYRERIHALSHSLMQQMWAIDQAVMLLDFTPEGRLSYVNPQFLRISGFSAGDTEAIQRSWALDPERYADLARAAPTEPVWTGEIVCLGANGEPIWVKRTVVPSRDDSGRVIKYTCLDIDISREKASEARLAEEKARAEVTLHSIADGVLRVDARGLVRYANPAAERILHRELRALVGTRLGDLITASTGADAAGTLNVRLPAGGEAVIELSRAPVHDARGRQAGEVLAFRDVGERHRIQRELNRLSMAVEHSASAIFITDPQGRIDYVNPKFTQMTGFTREEILGQTPRFLRSGQVQQRVYHAMWASLRSGKGWRGELVNRRKDGSTFWCEVTLTVVLDAEGHPRQFVSAMEDVSERKEAEATIHRLAYFDALTHLPNRRMFMERAVDVVKAARASGTPLAMCYLDLDGFKQVNDTLGHQVGDALLTEVARRVGQCLRPEDFLGRLGGDEFALLLHDVAGPDDVNALGQRIIQALDTAFSLDGQTVRVSTSIGVSLYPLDGQDVADLLRKADIALYQAKAAGKHRLEYFSVAFEARQRERAELEAALRVAEDRGELRLVYQPKVDIETKAVVGAEALVRWQHPERGLVRPDEFIPLAEETRLIVPIGRWVLVQACRQIRRWTDQGLDGVRVAVNISSVQFRSPGLVEDIARIVRDSRIAPEQLEIEITESGLMEDPEAVTRTLQRLRAIGLTIAVDDFGTGYSSLAYLKSFPVSVLKIDRSFVRDLETDEHDRGIAAAVMSMARVLKVDVVAEGVETAGQLAILEQMGCQLAQGFYMSRPLDPEAFAAYWWRHQAQPRFTPTGVDELASS